MTLHPHLATAVARNSPFWVPLTALLGPSALRGPLAPISLEQLCANLAEAPAQLELAADPALDGVKDGAAARALASMGIDQGHEGWAPGRGLGHALDGPLRTFLGSLPKPPGRCGLGQVAGGGKKAARTREAEVVSIDFRPRPSAPGWSQAHQAVLGAFAVSNRGRHVSGARARISVERPERTPVLRGPPVLPGGPAFKPNTNELNAKSDCHEPRTRFMRDCPPRNKETNTNQ